MIDTHQALNMDSKSKVGRLETELQIVTEKLNQTTQNRHEEMQALERKCVEAQQQEEKLTIELEEIKNERNRRVQEYQLQPEKEREAYKSKLQEVEKKAKDAESKRAQLLFQIEKDRANWVLEEEQLRRKQ